MPAPRCRSPRRASTKRRSSVSWRRPTICARGRPRFSKSANRSSRGSRAGARTMRTIDGSKGAVGRRVAVIVSKYNDFVTDRLQAGALAALAGAGVASSDITVVRVPGAFEIPLAAQHAAESGRFDAVVCLGCLIRGETPHFEYISSAVSQGLTTAAAATGVPMAFGVLTTNSAEEAVARAGDGPGNKGHESAMAAIEMAEVIAQLANTTPRP